MKNRYIHNLFRQNYSTKVQNKLDKRQKWNSVVGLEIHAQISSKSKLFSGSSTSFGKPPNSCVSFFDCATPGTLPVLNKRCVEAGVLSSLAFFCKINQISLFDRKHYFYADLPSGYQITQQRQPLAINGKCEFYVFNPSVHKEPYLKTSKIKQIQLEQDSGKSIHDEYSNRSLIDLNRAGVPLMELVFEPDLKDGEEAAALVKELTFILKKLETCSCKMEEGALRVDANISVNKHNEPLGIRTEVKNISSFRAIAKAIDFEIKRQIKVLENGGEIVNETLTWDAEKNKTISMRDKETKQDYRFMPEPNLPPLHLHVNEKSDNKFNLISAVSLKLQLPKMPNKIRTTMTEKYQIPLKTTLQIMNTPEILDYFENIVKLSTKSTPKQIANFLVINFLEFLYKHEIELNESLIKENQVGELIDMLTTQQINIHVAKKVLSELFLISSKSPQQVVEENDWYQITDKKELTKICQQIMDENPKLVQDYRKGKTKGFKFLISAVAKNTDEKAHMAMASEIMKELLK